MHAGRAGDRSGKPLKLSTAPTIGTMRATSISQSRRANKSGSAKREKGGSDTSIETALVLAYSVSFISLSSLADSTIWRCLSVSSSVSSSGLTSTR